MNKFGILRSGFFFFNFKLYPCSPILCFRLFFPLGKKWKWLLKWTLKVLLDIKAYLRKWLGHGRMGGALIRIERRESLRARANIFLLQQQFQSNRILMWAWVKLFSHCAVQGWSCMESSGLVLSKGQIAGLNWLSPEVGGKSQPSAFLQVSPVIHVHGPGWTVASYIGLSLILIIFSTGSQNRNGDLYTPIVRYQESSDQ